ncbi:hypothetical protein NDU88_004530 [Pleurodeles waltl]|uniref:Uncharacterized protein n=1 Tax=Pleurodeles waltl TaxID=8319 RepID=A0AAV7QGG3_PLEWA|nr:hypothetical protein NDU88_004530 [Pleurodeles waltl]
MGRHAVSTGCPRGRPPQGLASGGGSYCLAGRVSEPPSRRSQAPIFNDFLVSNEAMPLHSASPTIDSMWLAKRRCPTG